jgi:hypothetical protein
MDAKPKANSASKRMFVVVTQALRASALIKM